MKKDIMDAIKQVWLHFPKLRFCQIIGNCFPAGDLYYKSDSELLDSLKRAYPEVFKETK